MCFAGVGSAVVLVVGRALAHSVPKPRPHKSSKDIEAGTGSCRSRSSSGTLVEQAPHSCQIKPRQKGFSQNVGCLFWQLLVVAPFDSSRGVRSRLEEAAVAEYELVA